MARNKAKINLEALNVTIRFKQRHKYVGYVVYEESERGTFLSLTGFLNVLFSLIHTQNNFLNCARISIKQGRQEKYRTIIVKPRHVSSIVKSLTASYVIQFRPIYSSQDVLYNLGLSLSIDKQLYMQKNVRKWLSVAR